MSENLVPLGLLALEGHGDGNVDTLARLLAAEVVVDPATGLKSVHPTTARRLHDEWEEAKRAAAHRRQDFARQLNPTVQRVQAIQAHQQALQEAGVIGPDTPAIAVVGLKEYQEKADRLSRNFYRLKAAGNPGSTEMGWGATFSRIEE